MVIALTSCKLCAPLPRPCCRTIPYARLMLRAFHVGSWGISGRVAGIAKTTFMTRCCLTSALIRAVLRCDHLCWIASNETRTVAIRYFNVEGMMTTIEHVVAVLDGLNDDFTVLTSRGAAPALGGRSRLDMLSQGFSESDPVTAYRYGLDSVATR